MWHMPAVGVLHRPVESAGGVSAEAFGVPPSRPETVQLIFTQDFTQRITQACLTYSTVVPEWANQSRRVLACFASEGFFYWSRATLERSGSIRGSAAGDGRAGLPTTKAAGGGR